MIKIRKKILAVLLTAAMLVSMSSLVAWSDEQFFLVFGFF